MSNSLEANTALISYLRFKRQMPYVCTECDVPGNAKADVLASDGKLLHEYEVKVSVSDTRVDLDKRKHIKYKESVTGTPNTLTYVVHKDIAEKAMSILPEEYGVIAFTDFRFHSVKVLRKPKKLHDRPVTPATLLKMAKRMSSEIANHWISLVCRLDLNREELIREVLDNCLKMEKVEIDSILDMAQLESVNPK